ncbi:MAG: phosphotransferase [Chloroflexota bacterium]
MINTIATAPLADHKLPALYIALNDLLMEQVLNTDKIFLGKLQMTGPVSVQHQLLKYAPGKRCVVAYYIYELHTGQSIRLIGKLYRENRGQHIFRRMSHLWEARRRNRGEALMAHPLHYLPSVGIILQQQVTGSPLGEMLGSTQLFDAVASAGQNLAVLHETYLPGLIVRESMSDHIVKYCRPMPMQIAQDLPFLGPQIEAIVNRLVGDETLTDLPLTTVHNDLNLAHVYWDQGKTLFIDFDGLCLSHAALDIANFRVALQVYLGQQGELLADCFLNAYLEARGANEVPGLARYESLAYLRRATICCRKQAQPNWLEQTEWLLQKSWAALEERTAVYHANTLF